MLYAYTVFEDVPSVEDAVSPPEGGNPNVATDRDLSQAPELGAPSGEWTTDVGQPEASAVDARIFRPEIFDLVWAKVVGVRADRARGALTPEAWRRLWLNGYTHLRACSSGRYAATAYGLERAIAVLAPVIRRIEADFRQADDRSAVSHSPISSRHAPSSATLARWLREEAGTQLPTRLPRRVSELPTGSLRTCPGPIRP